VVERLGDAGCDEALIELAGRAECPNSSPGEGDAAHSAILSAIADVRRALPDAELVEVTPDLVWRMTDVATWSAVSTEHAPACSSHARPLGRSVA